MNQLGRTLTVIALSRRLIADRRAHTLAAGERAAELLEARWSSLAWKTLVEVAGA